MKVNDVKRVYVPISKDLAVATDWALVNGKRSNLPLGPGEYAIESIEDLQEAGYPIDESRSLVAAGQKGQVQQGHFEFRLLVPETKTGEDFDFPEKGVVKIGVVDGSLVLDGSGHASVDGLVVSGGNFEDGTLDVLASLAREGSYLKITAMHLDADDDKHYTSKMVERQWGHDGTSDGDRNIYYPKAASNDNQTNIRSIMDLGVYLDGSGYLEMPIYRGVGVNITISTEYMR